MKNQKEDLLDLLLKSYKTEPILIDRFVDFVERNEHSFYKRSNPEGHISASALVVNENMDKVLLTHHGKYDRWLQLGGHWDNIEESCFETAIREVFEEGYNNQEIPFNVINDGSPLDIDIHDIGDHYHFDVCFVIKVDDILPVHCSSESKEVKWINIEDLESGFKNNDIRMLRMIGKVEDIKSKLMQKKEIKLF